MTRTITTIRKETEYGYALEARFIMDKHDQGGVTYERSTIENWGDHICYPPLHGYEKYRNAKEGNSHYKRLIADGYVFISKETFVPTKMDNR